MGEREGEEGRKDTNGGTRKGERWGRMKERKIKKKKNWIGVKDENEAEIQAQIHKRTNRHEYRYSEI